MFSINKIDSLLCGASREFLSMSMHVACKACMQDCPKTALH